MLDIILTVLFGWAGYWKFKNGKIGLGILWILTFGAFGFGWLYDIVFALVAFVNSTKTTASQSKPAPRPAVPAPVLRPGAPPVSAPRPGTPTPAPVLRPVAPAPVSTPRPVAPAPAPVLRPVVPAPVSAPRLLPQTVQQWRKWGAIHSEPDQQKRITSAKKAENTPLTIDKNSAVGSFSGSHGVYSTTLETCNCADFSNRNKPCKHIYRLAIECGLIDAGAFYSDRNAVKSPDDEVPVVALSHVNIGKPIGSLGCYLTYTPDVLEPPTDRQLAYLKDLGVLIPSGVTKQDASCMISRATGDDSEEGPSSELVDLAIAFGVKFSAFIGAENLLYYVVSSISGKDRAALYAYAVQQSLADRPFGNMLADPDRDRFYAFADIVTADASLIKSLDGRRATDFLKPQRSTKIYKAAAAFLEGGAQ